ncbi:SprT-like domain-containing protein, partial [Salmonella enterica subsp. enterica serovar Typhimurium]|nr:SprT-like domain-containing protein [Salmonella enterica subsp. enterica serovar Typhimurium]
MPLLHLQREKQTYGYFSPERFVNSQGTRTDEIAMNPAYFAVCPPEEIMQTLCHEMCHLWQHHFGKPGRRGYHNKEWADFMEAIGLMPSSTGAPGGARTGDKMADYAIEGGRFLEAYESLMTDDYRISWMDRFPSREKLMAAIANGTTDEMAGDLSIMGL